LLDINSRTQEFAALIVLQSPSFDLFVEYKRYLTNIYFLIVLHVALRNLTNFLYIFMGV